METPPPRRVDLRREPDQQDSFERASSFSKIALRAGMGDDISALTERASRLRYRFTAPSTAWLAVLLVALCLSVAIGIISQRSATAEEIPADTQSERESKAVQTPAVEASQSPSPATLVVYISGAVAHPGVVQVANGARLNDVVNAAGGLSSDAQAEAINLAAHVHDGEHVHVPRIGEAEQPVSAHAPGSTDDDQQGVDLNSASQAELETIPGVGPVTAKAIISYREEHGAFASVDDLIGVSGIGEKTIDAMREHVRVN